MALQLVYLSIHKHEEDNEDEAKHLIFIYISLPSLFYCSPQPFLDMTTSDFEAMDYVRLERYPRNWSYFWSRHHQHTDVSSSVCNECMKHFKEDEYFENCYLFPTCRLKWHRYCIPDSPDDISHPCHPNHPLKFLVNGRPNYSNGKCHLCQEKLGKFVYHCSLC